MKLILTKLTDDQLDGLKKEAYHVRFTDKNKRLNNTVTLPDEAFEKDPLQPVLKTLWTPNKEDFKQTD